MPTPAPAPAPNPVPQVEEYHRLNDVGAPNGEFVTCVNGHRHFNFHNLQLRTAANQMLNCSCLVIGMDHYVNAGSTNGVTVWYDDHYLDTSRARLCPGERVGLGAGHHCTPLAATQWSAGGHHGAAAARRLCGRRLGVAVRGARRRCRVGGP